MTREEKLRKIGELVNDNCWPFSPDNWPGNIRTNCYNFALGIPMQDSWFSYLGRICDSYNKTLLEDVLFDINTIPGLEARLVENEEELLSDEYLIMFLHRDYKKPPYYDFHFIRKINGVWSHKNGFDCKPEVISYEEVKELCKEFCEKPKFLAIRKAR